MSTPPVTTTDKVFLSLRPKDPGEAQARFPVAARASYAFFEALADSRIG